MAYRKFIRDPGKRRKDTFIFREDRDRVKGSKRFILLFGYLGYSLALRLLGFFGVSVGYQGLERFLEGVFIESNGFEYGLAERITLL